MPMLILLNVETLENAIHNTITTFAYAAHQCIKESKMQTPSLIILCEDASFIGYEHSKTKVCMAKMMASLHCSFKCVNRNNLCFYYMSISDVSLSFLHVVSNMQKPMDSQESNL